MVIIRDTYTLQLCNKGTYCVPSHIPCLLIWIPDEPNLFNENVCTYRSYPLIQRNIYLLFINVKNEIIGLHRKE